MLFEMRQPREWPAPCVGDENCVAIDNCLVTLVPDLDLLVAMKRQDPTRVQRRKLWIQEIKSKVGLRLNRNIGSILTLCRLFAKRPRFSCQTYYKKEPTTGHR